MRYRILCIIVLLAWAGGLAYSQSGSPAPPNWRASVQALAAALVDSADHDALGRYLPADTPIRRFDRQVSDDRLSLIAATGDAVVLAALGYADAPDTVASDLSEHLRDAVFIPEQLRRQFVLESRDQIRQANETSAHWVRSALQPGVEQPVGVIVLWQVLVPAVASEQPQGRLIFVLVKASLAPSGEYQVTQLLYGDTRQIIR